ncbi:adapter protein CIKS isoform X1 [Gadus morhua]|uniref:adapter protein CIKS isoform X1 n=2 Tax=Gadus morhua TaxID=8049 RepID=UPI0011B6863B|nr:adapter protein CIKS-like isoform X1 [Gadus morhua]XP_030227853.1 adapter protein CIKS-like isoform X1 [Gadus morhua]
MFDGKSLIMLPSPVCPTSSPNSSTRRPNTPQEDDETMSQLQSEGGTAPGPASRPSHAHHGNGCDSDPKHPAHHPAHFLSEMYCSSYPPAHHPHQPHPHHPTPFPSRAPDSSWGPGTHPSYASSGWSGAGFPGRPANSCLSGKDFSRQSGESALYPADNSSSLPGRYSPSMGSLEQPYSLHSNHPSPELYHHTMSPYYCQPPGPACWAQCPPEAFKRGPAFAHQMPMLVPHLPYAPFYPNDTRARGVGGMDHPNDPAKKENTSNSSQLSPEQRKVFVTYEADNEEHVNKVINFVALLRHNGFDTHIDMFEQQFRSISKIDFMERYLSEKEYLIIIIISPKYYDTVSASPFGLENDERTLNTVYIHKQLQNEFIQNGSKNFRFIPIIFPGGRKCHVPTWLQNTHVFSWPRDLDDIIRRLMRVEKYNPPGLGPLPTIISRPI